MASMRGPVQDYELKDGVLRCLVEDKAAFYKQDPTRVLALFTASAAEGCGIDDLQLAMQPLYTSKKHMERSGMGMTIMQTFADDFHIESEKGKGTLVTIKKRIHHGKDSEQ